MTRTADIDRDTEMEALRDEVRKLRKINAVLMDRVERSSDMAGNAFSMFETAISLEALVRTRTSELEDALTRLASVNAELAQAQEKAEAAQMRLRDAIESVNEGFAIFDSDDRLILCNEAYLSFWPQVAELIDHNPTFQDIARAVAKDQWTVGAQTAPDRWVSDRLARHSIAAGGHVQALADGRWIQINELRTSEGGIVGIYTDITDVKAKDARDRARELAERNLVLQTTLDNLSEGVCVFDPDGKLTAWNDSLRQLLSLPDDVGSAVGTFDAMIGWCRDTLELKDSGILGRQVIAGKSRSQRLCHSRTHSFEVRSTTMERGGRVIGFKDVTDMLRAQASLKETAETLEKRVSERTAELVNLNSRLEEEVDERRAIEAALLDAKTAAEVANQSKTRFVAAASHDLLQPLNAARLFVSALGDRRLALPTRALVNQTSTALDSVEDLLEALLEISRLDAGAIQPEISHFRLDRLLQTLKVEFAPLAHEAGLSLDISTDLIWVKSDVRLVRRILQNFLSNALRYTQQGSVAVTCREYQDHIDVNVIDTGPGIPAEQQPLIFEEFRRFNTRATGKGLGLAIVKRASEMLDHRIVVTSEPGKGSCFSLSLPRGQEVLAEDESYRSGTRERSMQGLDVLVIDNEAQIQKGMRTLLSGWGCNVHVASGFGDAVEQYRDGATPGLLLADYHLDDDETGDAVILRLQEHFGSPIPSVMISADRSEEVKARLAGLGVTLLNKPVKPAQLRALMRTILK